jgi:hypothetical protein
MRRTFSVGLRIEDGKVRVLFAWEVVAVPRWESRKWPFSQADQPLRREIVRFDKSKGFRGDWMGRVTYKALPPWMLRKTPEAEPLK